MQDGTLSVEILSLQKLKAELEELKKASMYHAGDVINIEKMFLNGFITSGTKDAKFTIPIGKSIASDVTTVRVSGNFRFRQNGNYIKDYETTYGFDTGNGIDAIEYFNSLGLESLSECQGALHFQI